MDLDRDVERDRGVEEVMADANATIDNNGDAGDHVISINVSHSDSSETSLQSVGVNKVIIHRKLEEKYELSAAACSSVLFYCLNMMHKPDKV